MSHTTNLLDTSVRPQKTILLLAWPTIVEQILQTAVSYVDTAMVGSVGVLATAAISVNTSTIWLINGIMHATGIGFSVIVSRLLGAGERQRAKQVIRQAVLAIFVLGILFTCAALGIIAPNLARWMGAEADVVPLAQKYMFTLGSVLLFNMMLVISSYILRGCGDTKTPLKYNILTNVINICGNFLLIYAPRDISIFGWTLHMWGADLGVWGAAIATAAATAFSGVMMLRALFLKRGAVPICLTDPFRPDPKIIRQAVRLGVPTALERITICTGQLIMTMLISGCGTAALAAHQMANTAESLCYMTVFGFSTSATTLVAQALGAGNKDLAYVYGRWCNRLSLWVMIVTSVLMFVFAEGMIRLLIADAQVIALGALVLRIQSFAEPAQSLANVYAGVFRGSGDVRWPFYISIAGMWCVRVVLAVILVKGFHLGLEAVWIAMAIDWFARGGISLWRFLSKKWLNAWKA